MPTRTRGLRTVVAALAVAAGVTLVAACSGDVVLPQAGGTRDVLPEHGVPQTTVAPPPQNVSLLTDHARQSPGVIASGGKAAPYNYAPTVLATGGRYQMWWCSQLPGAPRPGDQILYATGTSLNGPFAGPDGAAADEVFGNSAGGFDGLHTCDPSVIEVGGVYYLYYTGTADRTGNTNAIGLATSSDGVHWVRANNGAPIVSAARDIQRSNAYGAGQPSALYLDGWFYLMFTDTTGTAADPDGGGQFVLRSTDPAFGQRVQALGPNGFTSVSSATSPRTRVVVDAATSDWLWSDALGAFAIASDGAGGTTITFWDAGFTYHPYQSIMIPGAQDEGPGLVRTALGHAPVAAANPCGQVPLDVVRATTNTPAPNGLADFGIDVDGLRACQNRTVAQQLLNGFAVPAPDRTVDIVTTRGLVEVERRSVALELAAGIVDNPPAAVLSLPVVAHLKADAAAVTAPDRTVGVPLDGGRLWVIGANAAALNASPVATVTDQQWDAYPRGVDLTGLRP
jgi:hypothetical protein